MRNVIGKRLARAASLVAQRRYISNATREEYLLPEELLEDVSQVIRQIREQPHVRSALSDRTAQLIIKLEPLLDSAERELNQGKANSEIIESEAWKILRLQVGRCLDELGFDLDAWEQSNG